MARGSSQHLPTLLFHAVFWTVWLLLPFVDRTFDNERDITFLKIVFPISLINIPLFFINSHWLQPRIFPRYGLIPYILSLVVLFIVFIGIQTGVRLLLENYLGIDHRRPLIGFFQLLPVAFVTAVSTGYGFVQHMTAQQRLQVEQKQERLQTELAFLRSQVSPHFLFNVLNSLVYLIRSDAKIAENVTIRLSELMRYMLYESDDAVVPLHKELAYLENYIQLQRIRFGEDVAIQYQVTGATHATNFIEPMLLIPFVENAFKHGVGVVSEPAIDIKVQCSDSDFSLEVGNTFAASDAARDKNSGIGLRNVQRRLELLYPTSHDLQFSSTPNWFVVRLNLKLKSA